MASNATIQKGNNFAFVIAFSDNDDVKATLEIFFGLRQSVSWCI
jgi:hypothetical protein